MANPDELNRMTEIAALQRDHIEVARQLGTCSARMDGLENSICDIYTMLKESLKMKRIEYEFNEEVISRNSYTHRSPSSHLPLNRAYKPELPLFDGDRVEE